MIRPAKGRACACKETTRGADKKEGGIEHPRAFPFLGRRPGGGRAEGFRPPALSGVQALWYDSNMQIGVRFRCYPTPEQAQTLAQWIGCQRFIYNAKVREDRYFRRFARTSLQHTGQHLPIDQCYRQFKTDLTPWLSEVPSQVLRIQVGAEGSEPRTETSSTPDEITVRREGGNTFAHGSLTPETPLQPVGLSGGRLHRVVSRLNVNRKSKQNDRTRYAGLLAPFFMDTTWPREADLRINP